MQENVEYGFQVRTKSANGKWGDFNSPIYWSSSDKPTSTNTIPDRTSIDEKDGVQVRVAVGVIGNCDEAYIQLLFIYFLLPILVYYK